MLTDSIQLACNEQGQELEVIRQQLDILRDGSYSPVALHGTDLQPDALATVYYNVTNGANYIDILQLPAPPAGMAYQLWTLVPDEDPINMGQVSQAEGFVLQDFPYAEGAIAFAVTLEPVSGSEQPTLDQMVLYGTLG
ncbi:MAG: anti-sigma factor [Bacteroidota bacterium]